MFACKHICVQMYTCVYVEARAEISLECCSSGYLLPYFCLFICLGLYFAFAFVSWDRFSLNMKLTSSTRPAGQCTLLSLPPLSKDCSKCLTASFFMSVLEIKLWPSAYMVSTILMKPYLQTPACFCIVLRSRVTVLSDSLSDNCKYAPPYNGMTRQLCFHFLFPFNEFFLVRKILDVLTLM